jgi:hypothetical protein
MTQLTWFLGGGPLVSQRSVRDVLNRTWLVGIYRRVPEHRDLQTTRDHNESRSWHGWHRHVFLVMLVFAMMAAIRHRANPPPPKKTKRRTTAKTKAQPRRH